MPCLRSARNPTLYDGVGIIFISGEGDITRTLERPRQSHGKGASFYGEGSQSAPSNSLAIHQFLGGRGLHGVEVSQPAGDPSGDMVRIKCIVAP